MVTDFALKRYGITSISIDFNVIPIVLIVKSTVFTINPYDFIIDGNVLHIRSINFATKSYSNEINPKGFIINPTDFEVKTTGIKAKLYGNKIKANNFRVNPLAFVIKLLVFTVNASVFVAVLQ
uniref:Uncharacterized protein n=1 Tax=Sphingobacterium sp. (strain 21) TaxID=743722 RepID=F4C2L4_SPHS2